MEPNKISLLELVLVVAVVVLAIMIFMKPSSDPARVQLLENRIDSLESQVAPPDGYHLELMTIWRVCDPAFTNPLNASECSQMINAGLARYYVYGNLTMGGFR